MKLLLKEQELQQRLNKLRRFLREQSPVTKANIRARKASPAHLNNIRTLNPMRRVQEHLKRPIRRQSPRINPAMAIQTLMKQAELLIRGLLIQQACLRRISSIRLGMRLAEADIQKLHRKIRDPATPEKAMAVITQRL